MSEKLNAAFILFDTDNSGTMGFDELVALVKTVFSVIEHEINHKVDKGDVEPDKLFCKIDY